MLKQETIKAAFCEYVNNEFANQVYINITDKSGKEHLREIESISTLVSEGCECDVCGSKPYLLLSARL